MPDNETPKTPAPATADVKPSIVNTVVDVVKKNPKKVILIIGSIIGLFAPQSQDAINTAINIITATLGLQ